MKESVLVSAVMGLAVFGCGGPIVDDGNAELGVARFEASSRGDRLELTGVGPDGQRVVSLDVQVGMVTDGDHTARGRSLTVRVDGRERNYSSIGLEPVHLAPPRDPKLEAFLLDSYVAAQLAKHGILMGLQERAPAAPGVDYGHGGDCSVGDPDWIPGCGGAGATDCCMTHLNGDGYQAQSVVCGYSNTRADRACFAEPSCTGGKAYGSNPVGCDQSGQLDCPQGAQTANQVGSGKWQCRVESGAPNECANKNVGPLGCAVCWTEGFSGYQVVDYNSGGDSCSYSAQCAPEGWWCDGGGECCTGLCDGNSCASCISNWNGGCDDAGDCCDPYATCNNWGICEGPS